ncbi:hypothetical protein [Sinomonas flava]|uniref:Uncharacterized protein n=1 Tax=Sinomonas flava TaxID=496857 RepID=A0ABN3BRE4_9MICC
MARKANTGPTPQRPSGQGPEAKAKRPFWKKKRFIIPAALLFLIIIISALSGRGGNTSQPSANQASETASPSATTQPAAPSPSQTAPAPAATQPAPAPKTTQAAPAPAPKIQPFTRNGAGDDVFNIDLGGNPAIVMFDCPACSSNTVLQTNGRDSLLVNTIGAYKGSHLIDTSKTSNTTELTVKADGDWTVTITDPSTAPRTDGPAQGHGDAVVYMEAKSSKASITNTGKGNFVVTGYASAFPQLAVNEIGSYKGTVPLSLPAFVQVISEGDWTITPG